MTYRKRSIEDLDIDNLNQIFAIKHTSLSYICILKQRAIDFPRLLMYTNRHLKMETIANPCMFACLAFMIRSTSETTGKKPTWSAKMV